MSWNAGTAEWYAENYGEYATNRLAIDELELASSAVLADIGCGTGAALRHASGRVGTLIGIDPVPRMLEIAEERAQEAGVSIDFRRGDASKLPLDEDSCDVVLAFDSMDHWDDVDAGLREVRRVLVSGGTFVVVKDAGVPGEHDAASVLAAFGFEVKRSETVRGEVAFSLVVATHA